MARSALLAKGYFLRSISCQIALAVVDPRTYFVKAMAGGVDYGKSQFNRHSILGGSPDLLFKPSSIYAAFARRKIRPLIRLSTTLPSVIATATANTSPQNYAGGFGAVSIRRALEVSNIPAVKLFGQEGLNAIEICRVPASEVRWNP